MVFPYRTPASIDPDLAPARPVPLDRWIRAVSLATVIFLLTATAMMLSLLHDLAGSHLFPRNSAPAHAAQSASHQAAPGAPTPNAPRPPPGSILTRIGPMTPRASTPPLALSSLGATTHDPAVLLARATRLLRDGADITLTRSMLPMPIDGAVEEAFAPHTRIAARRAWGGVEIESLPLGSTASLAGLQSGDVLTAINGYALIKPEDVIEAHRSLMATGVAVLEVIRGESRVVLEARFRRSPRPAAAR
jgi:membrane-associated protease RseP (regulator of RpoE activity)